jgi:hypothetical protein
LWGNSLGIVIVLEVESTRRKDSRDLKGGHRHTIHVSGVHSYLPAEVHLIDIHSSGSMPIQQDQLRRNLPFIRR